jgi:ubiquinone/menaquinone biosynthesis C-methylase UbiE
MTTVAQNDPFIAFWNDVLASKFEHFRNILTEGMRYHSDIALSGLALSPGASVLDVGCGWGDTALALARQLDSGGSVLGIDCCEAFLKRGRKDALSEGLSNVEFIAADVQTYPFAPNFDLCFSRFGMMFFSSPVAALRNLYRGLKPGGEIIFITWRTLDENPWLSAGKQTVLRFLPPPGENAQICGPGPFSMANPEKVFAQLGTAGFTDLTVTAVDGPVTVGANLEQAVDFQLAIGPAGEIFREAGKRAERRRVMIAHALRDTFAGYQDDDGKVIMSSASWIFRARKPLP